MLSIGSLCTGYGGLELAIDEMGIPAKLAWVSEIDPAASAVLAAHYNAPNIGDLRQAEPDPVDIITAGFPCQPLSVAGNRKGLDDERWIWGDIASLLSRMDPPPGLLLFENVPGLLTANDGRALAEIIGDLARLGYVGRYRLLRAADVGACHQRKRWFCVATHTERLRDRSEPIIPRRDGGDLQPECPPLPQGAEGPQPEDPPPRHLSTPQASDGSRGPDYARVGRRATHRSGGHDLTTAVAMLPTPTATDAKGGRNATLGREDNPHHGNTMTDIAHADRWGEYADAIAHQTAITGPPPEPTTGNGRLTPAFVEWMMMLPPGWVTHPGIGLARTHQLRILGNGVVPAQAAAAYTELLTEG